MLHLRIRPVRDIGCARVPHSFRSNPTNEGFLDRHTRQPFSAGCPAVGPRTQPIKLLLWTTTLDEFWNIFSCSIVCSRRWNAGWPLSNAGSFASNAGLRGPQLQLFLDDKAAECRSARFRTQVATHIGLLVLDDTANLTKVFKPGCKNIVVLPTA